MAFLTVFTPTYNRAHTLGRTYESLFKQKCKEFIWLIVDDGSTDQTKELVRKWQKQDNGFEIQYIYNEINNRNIIMDILNFTYYFLIYNLIFN